MSIEFVVGLIIGILIGIVSTCLMMSIKRPKKNELVEELTVFKHKLNKEISYRKSSLRIDYNMRLY